MNINFREMYHQRKKHLKCNLGVAEKHKKSPLGRGGPSKMVGRVLRE
jgi:hypothetical protein